MVLRHADGFVRECGFGCTGVQPYMPILFWINGYKINLSRVSRQGSNSKHVVSNVYRDVILIEGIVLAAKVDNYLNPAKLISNSADEITFFILSDTNNRIGVHQLMADTIT